MGYTRLQFGRRVNVDAVGNTRLSFGVELDVQGNDGQRTAG